MECPRCGNDLDRYTLDSRETVSCGCCGYIGISVEHRSKPQFVESWEEAISRYPDASRIESVSVETVDEDPSLEVIISTSVETDAQPDPTLIRVEEPDPRLAAAFEAAVEADEKFVCDICGKEFESQQGLYGHLSVHSKENNSNASND